MQQAAKRRGFFAVGIYHPKHEENQGTLWRAAFAFGASFCFTVGPRFTRQASDTPKSWKQLPFFTFQKMTDLFEHLPYGAPLIGVELTENARDLTGYRHPEQACYLLGAEDHGLPREVLALCHQTIQIAGLAICLNVATTGALVMYDRHQKSTAKRNDSVVSSAVRSRQKSHSPMKAIAPHHDQGPTISEGISLLHR